MYKVTLNHNFYFRYPPPSLRHAWRVVLTAVCSGTPVGLPSHPFRNSCWISTLRLVIPPEFRKELTESQSFQRRRYPTNPQNATPLMRNPLFGPQMLINRRGRHLHRLRLLRLGAHSRTQKSNENPTCILHASFGDFWAL